MTRWLVVMALVVGTACGGGSDTFSSRSAQAVANKLGCSRFEPNEEVKLLTREHGTCTLDQSKVQIQTYSNNAAQDRVDDMINTVGLSSGVYVLGKGWIVSCTTEATCKRVQDRLGGELG